MTWLRVVLLVAALVLFGVAAWSGNSRPGWLAAGLATLALALPTFATL